MNYRYLEATAGYLALIPLSILALVTGSHYESFLSGFWGSGSYLGLILPVMFTVSVGMLIIATIRRLKEKKFDLYFFLILFLVLTSVVLHSSSIREAWFGPAYLPYY